MSEITRQEGGCDFDPAGFVGDEGGAIQKGLVDHYGLGVRGRMKACDFHFFQDRNRYAKYCSSTQAKERFKQLTEKWKNALTPLHYSKAFEDLQKFVNEKPSKRGPIKGFLKFWDQKNTVCCLLQTSLQCTRCVEG
jgi:hypothetical protein